MGDASSGKLRVEVLSVIGHRGDCGMRRRNVRKTTTADDAEERNSRRTLLL